MQFELIPYKSAGDLLLGSHKTIIDNQLGNNFKQITYSYSADSADDYNSIGVRVEYNENLNSISIDISSPSLAMYENMNLLSLKFDELPKQFASEKNAFIQEHNVLLLDTGIGFTFDSNLEKVIIVTVFIESLFDPYTENFKRLW